MCCRNGNLVEVSKMALEIKSGPLLSYKRRFFGRNWRDVHSVLYNDSSFIWYEEKSRNESKGGIVLKDAPELIAFGTFTFQVPDKPNLPHHHEPKELLAFGVRGTKTVYWFLCPNEEEVVSWIDAIASTLTPPPQMPTPTAPPNPHQELTPASQYPTEQSTPQHNPGEAAPQNQPQQPPPQDTPNQQQMPQDRPQTAGFPCQCPQQTNYQPPPNHADNTVSPYPQPYPSHGGGPTTVDVQQVRPGYGEGGGGGSCAMAMILAGVLGTAWGVRHYGIGGGWGTGGGRGHRHYNNTTTSVEQTAVEKTVPQPEPVAAVEDATCYVPVAEPVVYLPTQDAVYGTFDCGDYDADLGGGDFGGGDCGAGDCGGGDFGDGDFGCGAFAVF